MILATIIKLLCFVILIATYLMIDLFFCVKIKEDYGPLKCSSVCTRNFYTNFPCGAVLTETRVDTDFE
jgi:hypothetical protein